MSDAGDDVAEVVDVHHFAYEPLVGKAKLGVGERENGRQFSAYVWRQVAAAGNMSGRRRENIAAMKGMTDWKLMILRIFERYRLIIAFDARQGITQDAVVGRDKLIVGGLDGNRQTGTADSRVNYGAKGCSDGEIAVAVQQGKGGLADILRLDGVGDVYDSGIGDYV